MSALPMKTLVDNLLTRSTDADCSDDLKTVLVESAAMINSQHEAIQTLRQLRKFDAAAAGRPDPYRDNQNPK